MVSINEMKRYTICLVIVLHVQERVVFDFTSIVDVWSISSIQNQASQKEINNLLDAPVILEVLKQLLLVEETRVEATHVAISYGLDVSVKRCIGIRLHATIHCLHVSSQ